MNQFRDSPGGIALLKGSGAVFVEGDEEGNRFPLEIKSDGSISYSLEEGMLRAWDEAYRATLGYKLWWYLLSG